MAKQNKTTELVWAKKDGYPKRQFTMQQLESMGTDTGGKTYDGWAVVAETKEPDEVKQKKSATKTAVDNGNTKGVHAAEGTADAGAKDSDIIGNDSPQSGEGDAKAS